MARRIAGVGRVTVSERRSTVILATVPARYNGAVTPDAAAPTADEAFGPPMPGEDPLLAELAAVALDAATGAAGLAAEAIGHRRVRVDTKSSSTDMVSEVDRDAEALIASLLAARRPDDGLLGEEGASRQGTTGVRWVVDPLDGTTNYLFGIPAWSVSVAAERDGRPVVGVVVDPSRQETWAAVEGRGARCNGRPCRVAEGRSILPAALLATGFGYDADRRAWQARVLTSVLPAVRDVRRFGSAALDLCWVAGGRFDGYYEWGLNPWDLSAGTIICREAGGVVDVRPGRLIVATTPGLRAPLGALLEEAGATGAAGDGPEPRTW
jgi:myo-inositol-1(or 4)-monophosphatase